MNRKPNSRPVNPNKKRPANRPSRSAGRRAASTAATPPASYLPSSPLRYTDELGNDRFIARRHDGLINLSQLATLAGQDVEAFFGNAANQAVVADLRRDWLAGFQPIVILPNPNQFQLRSAPLNPPTYWAHPAVAAFFLRCSDAKALSLWFEWQRELQGWNLDFLTECKLMTASIRSNLGIEGAAASRDPQRPLTRSELDSKAEAIRRNLDEADRQSSESYDNYRFAGIPAR